MARRWRAYGISAVMGLGAGVGLAAGTESETSAVERTASSVPAPPVSRSVAVSPPSTLASMAAATTTAAATIPDLPGWLAFVSNAPAPTTVSPPVAPPTGPLTYVVQAGDTLTGIANWFELHGYRDLYEANRSVIGADPNLIFPGQTITIGPGTMEIGPNLGSG